MTDAQNPWVDTGTVSVEVDASDVLNWAMEQNAVPLIRRVSIANLSESDLEGVSLRFESESGAVQETTVEIDAIGAGQRHVIEGLELRLDAARLAHTMERDKTQLWVAVTAGEETLWRAARRLDVLAYNQWPGTASIPDLLAAFVLPNHPAIQPLLTAASRHLKRAGGDGALNGYQQGDELYVKRMAAAVCFALAEKGVTYANPPASFEDLGQKIRTPEQILEGKLATCLDVSVLLAGALEQIGLHPLLLLVDGHAFVGVWLKPTELPFPATDDALPIRKRVDASEIAVFDSSAALIAAPFERLEAVGRAYLQDVDQFRLAIDVRAARTHSILPLPLRLVDGRVVTSTDEDATAAPTFVPPEELPTPSSSQLPVATRRSLERVDKWKAKLLDLSLRNRLLNFRPTKQTLGLLSPDLAAFEDMLADGMSFGLHARPEAFGPHDPRDPALLAQRAGDDPVITLLRNHQAKGGIHTTVGDAELNRRLKNIYRSARLSIEEKGANTLYVALGFLRWFDKPRSQEPRMAPLLLLPAQLHRDSARSPYQLRLADDDPRINNTLLQKLARDYGIDVLGLDELPQDDHGLNVPEIFQRFRHAVMDVGRWEVVEESCLGLFSFTKMMMWLDLEERTDALMKNPVVHQMLGPDAGGSVQEQQLPEVESVEQRHAASLLCPMDANSSQLAAVYGAAEGCSFVLQGPPGTGKSQTITNIIAHTLANDRTVLFVSEKMAALDVVHDRLRRVGLGPFCLQLHSDKTSKSEVARQLAVALEVSQPNAPLHWQARATELQARRDQLNAYVEALHRVHPIDTSYFQGVAAIVELRDVPAVDLDLGEARAIDVGQLGALEESVRNMIHVGGEIGRVADHPFNGTKPPQWSPDVASALLSDIETLQDASRELHQAFEAAAPQLGLPQGSPSRAVLETGCDIAAALLDAPALPRVLLVDPNWATTRPRLEAWIELGARVKSLWSELAQRYTDRLLKLPLQAIHNRYQSWADAFFLIAWLMLFMASRQIAGVARKGKSPPRKIVRDDLANALEVQEKLDAIRDASETGAAVLGSYWQGSDTDWPLIGRLVEWTEHVRQLLGRIMGWDAAQATTRRDHLVELAAAGPELLAEGTALGDILRRLRSAREAFQVACTQVCVDLTIDEEALVGEDDRYLDALTNRTASWLASGHLLRNWSVWVQATDEADRLGLAPLVRAQQAGQVETDQLLDVFHRSFYTWWTDRIAQSEPLLRAFNGIAHNRQVEAFRELDNQIVDLARQKVFAHLASRVPQGAPSVGGEMAQLRREIKKKTRHLATRKLFQAIPHVLPRLKPCVLMSPLSVAQYLDPDLEMFDVVVFDEASQIPPWDAIGAIARGTQVIVVGDSKQLPPTSFFQSGDREDEFLLDEDIAEMDSILEECVASGMQGLSLDWHFRSRHESLITFSNHRYYEGRLHTFPSAEMEVEHLGVKWRFVPDGVYDKGRTRQNRIEAQALVAEIVQRLRSPKEYPGTIGVVTFSQAQQTLIEDLLEEARGRHPEIEPFFLPTEDSQEYVFVKNLENVQGDERDVMYFSIGYGPDRDGRVAMNFGPLNRVGGERRLNVAITRARRQLVVFSSIHGDQIDLNRTRARGVADLRDFLLFAERGPDALAPMESPHADEAGRLPLERDIQQRLQDRGHLVDLHVGCMGYRVDLGIRDPERDGCYLLGIECDGPMYNSAHGARDRDRLRREVLGGLGWHLHRVWIIDWWQDPDGESARIERALEQVPSGDLDLDLDDEVEQEAPVTPPPAQRVDVDKFHASAAPQPAPTPQPVEPETPDLLLGPSEYVATQLDHHYSDFFDPSTIPDIAVCLAAVVHHESPIHRRLAARRVADAWAVKRVTMRVLGQVAKAAKHIQGEWRPRVEGDFYWWSKQRSSAWTEYRVPGDRRPADLIHPIEIANAAYTVLQGSIALERSELARLTARELGITRMGRKVQEAMDVGIGTLELQRRCRVEGESVSLRKGDV